MFWKYFLIFYPDKFPGKKNMKISLLFYISFILLFFCWHFMMKQLSYIYNFNFAANVNKSIDKIMKFHIEKSFNSIPLSSTLDKKNTFQFLVVARTIYFPTYSFAGIKQTHICKSINQLSMTDSGQKSIGGKFMNSYRDTRKIERAKRIMCKPGSTLFQSFKFNFISVEVLPQNGRDMGRSNQWQSF